MTHVYDKVGRQTARADQKNRHTTYTYDDVGQKLYQNTIRVTQTYDAAGQRTVLHDSTGRMTTWAK